MRITGRVRRRSAPLLVEYNNDECDRGDKGDHGDYRPAEEHGVVRIEIRGDRRAERRRWQSVDEARCVHGGRSRKNDGWGKHERENDDSYAKRCALARQELHGLNLAVAVGVEALPELADTAQLVVHPSPRCSTW
jgi:hypothetical protein